MASAHSQVDPESFRSSLEKLEPPPKVSRPFSGGNFACYFMAVYFNLNFNEKTKNKSWSRHVKYNDVNTTHASFFFFLTSLLEWIIGKKLSYDGEDAAHMNQL